jgi:hypothetical protein
MSNDDVIAKAGRAIVEALNDTKDSAGLVNANQGVTTLQLLEKAKTLTEDGATKDYIDGLIAKLPKASVYTASKGGRRTLRGGSMDIDDARKERNKLKLEMHELESEGESLTKAQRAHHGVLAKKVKKLNILITKLKNKTGGRSTRRH